MRQAVELGADVIKADPTDDDRRTTTAWCRRQRAAGARARRRQGPDDELLRRTRTLMAQGASGIVYGRNVIQHPTRPA